MWGVCGRASGRAGGLGVTVQPADQLLAQEGGGGGRVGVAVPQSSVKYSLWTSFWSFPLDMLVKYWPDAVMDQQSIFSLII